MDDIGEKEYLKCPHCGQKISVDNNALTDIQRKIVKMVVKNPGKIVTSAFGGPLTITIGGIVDEAGKEQLGQLADKVDDYLYGTTTFACPYCKCNLGLDKSGNLIQTSSMLDKGKEKVKGVTDFWSRKIKLGNK